MTRIPKVPAASAASVAMQGDAAADVASPRDGGTADGASTDARVSALGVWIEGSLYRLKAEDVRLCRAATTVVDAGVGVTRLGVRVEIARPISTT